jgi:hypothetical protein
LQHAQRGEPDARERRGAAAGAGGLGGVRLGQQGDAVAVHDGKGQIEPKLSPDPLARGGNCQEGIHALCRLRHTSLFSAGRGGRYLQSDRACKCAAYRYPALLIV